MTRTRLRPDPELLAAAVSTFELAGSACARDEDGGSCAWYHGAWIFFRALDLVSTSSKHVEHYRSEVRRMCTQTGFRPILISGSADYGMLETICDSAPGSDPPLSFTVVDRCSAPLRICGRFASARRLDCTTRQADIFAYTDDEPFDAVYTYAFLGYFEPGDRRRLLAHWHVLLRPGGRLVTVQRIRENYPFQQVRFTPSEADAFVQRVTAMSAFLPADFDAYPISELARRCTDELVNAPILTAAGLSEMIEASGFRTTRYEPATGTSAACNTGPAITAGGDYRLISAERI